MGDKEHEDEETADKERAQRRSIEVEDRLAYRWPEPENQLEGLTGPNV